MSQSYPAFLGSYRQTFSTGSVTGIAAASATAGHILALRYATAGKGALIKSLEVEFITTTAFTAAQRVGFDAIVARSYSAAHSGETALTISNGQKLANYPAPTLTGRISNTAALTAGTHTFDANPVARGSYWSSAVGAVFGPRFYDFTAGPLGGLLLQNAEGLVIRNTVAMGANGVGQWDFTVEWDAVDVS